MVAVSATLIVALANRELMLDIGWSFRDVRWIW